MNASVSSGRTPTGLRRPAVAAVATGLIVAAGILVAVARRGGDAPVAPVYTVTRAPLTIGVSESGTVQNRDKKVLYSQVEGRVSIVSLVDEGKTVQKGDLLIELDSSRLTEQRTAQEITVENSGAALVQARENLEIVRNQATADVERAQLDLRFAQLDLEKYEKGEYVMARQTMESAITLASEELRKAEEQVNWSLKLATNGFITRTELMSDELALKRKRIDLETAQQSLSVLESFTHRRDLEKRQSDVKQAILALDRARRKARSDMVKAETDLRARESEHQQQQSKLERVVRQVAACRIVAPDAGMVVYATTGGRGGNREPLRVGQDVSERQELINLPSGDAMNVEVKVQESNLRKVREGQTVLVRVDALPGDVFRGRLTRIGLLPDSTRAWLNPDLKVYNCIVELDAPSAKLRPGMGCRAEIVVQELDNAVFVPVQAVIRVKRRPTVYVVGKSPAEPRAIEIGLDNNRMVHVIRGLQPGEKVSLTPPLAEGEEPAADASSQAPQRAPEPGASSADGPPPGAAFTNGPPRRRGGERPGAGAPDSRHGRRPPA